MKYIIAPIILILFSIISTAQNSKNIPKILHKKLLNTIAGRYGRVDVTMGYAKGTGGIIIGNPNQSKYSLFNDFSFSIFVLRRQDQQFGSITNITAESNNLNDFLIRFDWKNKRTDQGTISGEIQLFYSFSKNRYDTYFINNSNSVFKIYWKTELDQIQKDSLNSLIKLLYKKEFQNESEGSKLKRLEEKEKEKENEISYQKYLTQKNKFEADRIREEMGLPPLKQSNESVIGIPVRIGNYDVAQNDFSKEMDWYDAKKACEALGNGWRLPNRDELNILFRNKDKIGGFLNEYYWSSTIEIGNESRAWYQYFLDGKEFSDAKGYRQNVRAIRINKQAEAELILIKKREEEALIKKYEAETLEKLKKINDFAKKTVENPITIGKIFIANNDFAEPMDWYDAKKACESLGYGWRLPTLVELKLLYRNKDKIGGFVSSDTFAYWSSSDWSSTEVSNGNGAWFMYFNKNTLRFGDPKTTKHFVRAVKDL